jgi:hypothetical protein
VYPELLHVVFEVWRYLSSKLRIRLGIELGLRYALFTCFLNLTSQGVLEIIRHVHAITSLCRLSRPSNLRIFSQSRITVMEPEVVGRAMRRNLHLNGCVKNSRIHYSRRDLLRKVDSGVTGLVHRILVMLTTYIMMSSRSFSSPQAIVHCTSLGAALVLQERFIHHHFHVVRMHAHTLLTLTFSDEAETFGNLSMEYAKSSFPAALLDISFLLRIYELQSSVTTFSSSNTTCSRRYFAS